MSTIFEVKRIFDELKAESSRNGKEKILRENQNNELFKSVLKFVYDPYVLTGLSSKKIKKKVSVYPERSIYDIIDLMHYLRSSNTGRDVDIVAVQQFVARQDVQVQELVTQIATKDLVIGCTANTMNKVYGEGFIRTFEVMLAEKWFDHADKLKDKPIIITEKLDGNRNVVFHDYSGITMFTRQGQLNEGFDQIAEEFEKYMPQGYVYDGEFIAATEAEISTADLYRETTSKVRKDGKKTGIKFHVFDMIPISDFQNGYCKTPCSERKKMLHEAIGLYSPLLRWIEEVPVLYEGTDTNMVQFLLDVYTKMGKEGVIVNIADAPYECKRTRNILKVKKMQTADLRVVGVEEGEGRLVGTLGRLNVEYKGNVVGVGSGFTDDQRAAIWAWENTEPKVAELSIIGKIVEIQYFEESKNSKTGEVSLRFPVFKGFRDDKTEPSYY